jgi:hypothetical protein
MTEVGEKVLLLHMEKLHEQIYSQDETIKHLMDKRLEKRQWQTLDDAEYQEILAKLGDGGLLAFYILIEAKLREKNT